MIQFTFPRCNIASECKILKFSSCCSLGGCPPSLPWVSSAESSGESSYGGPLSWPSKGAGVSFIIFHPEERWCRRRPFKSDEVQMRRLVGLWAPALATLLRRSSTMGRSRFLKICLQKLKIVNFIRTLVLYYMERYTMGHQTALLWALAVVPSPGAG